MEVGFFFWPYDPALVRRMAAAADNYGYDMIGIADTPGNAMDPWVTATMVAEATERARVALCVTNLASRHPAVSAASIASLDLLAPGRTVLGIGAGHSGTKNLGVASTSTAEMEAGIGFMRALLSGQPAVWQGGGEGHIPWVESPPKLFMAGSGPKALAAAGRCADGVFVNYGITAETIAQSEGTVGRSAITAGRNPETIEAWQIAALDCNTDAAAARAKLGAILAFMAAGYILGSGDLRRRGVPPEFHAAIEELRRRHSTRPGDADAKLVDQLGLFDYLAGRFAIYGTPEDCLKQLMAARSAGLKRVMFTVSVASDPAGTVELFGKEVLPAIRAMDD